MFKCFFNVVESKYFTVLQTSFLNFISFHNYRSCKLIALLITENFSNSQHARLRLTKPSTFAVLFFSVNILDSRVCTLANLYPENFFTNHSNLSTQNTVGIQKPTIRILESFRHQTFWRLGFE